ncbi:hypothetical protein Dda_4730 [Drechslerella dactyloides]|uniref:Cytochrome c oxidase assembly factor 6 n=1 Tax=Drechslerella dactyloides TaxID=74499 RepID=A0AAD6IXG4_DREDA|nr:hypothetical protein Dda_4730 [Drechslerella dactyloides]
MGFVGQCLWRRVSEGRLAGLPSAANLQPLTRGNLASCRSLTQPRRRRLYHAACILSGLCVLLAISHSSAGRNVRHPSRRPSDVRPRMGLLSALGLSSAPAAPSPPPAFPDRSARQKCWAARDGFFACLDRHAVLDSIRDAPAAQASCGTELKVFESDCASSWVEYFKKRRVQEAKKAQLLAQMEAEGGQKLGAIAKTDGPK